MSGHIPVLFHACMEALAPIQGIYVDGTLGGGGHAKGVLERGADRLIGFDKDEDAIERCRSVLAPWGDRVTLVHADFKQADQVLHELGIPGVDGVVLDLGVSSFQLDEAERGFSYSKQAPLDMRMDRSAQRTAETVVNTYSQADLTRILRVYGEEKFAARIARTIVDRRPVHTTLELEEAVKAAIPAAARRTGGHPAKRTFQAIRIEVNRELEGLEEATGAFIDMLNPGGKLAVITFHSLEDRAVKQAMRHAEHPCTCPPDFPVCVCGAVAKGRMYPHRPIVPDEQEVGDNPRARSAKLRVFVKGETNQKENNGVSGS